MHTSQPHNLLVTAATAPFPLKEPFPTAVHGRGSIPVSQRRSGATGQTIAANLREAHLGIMDADALKECRTIAVEGQPTSIVAVGGSDAAY